MPGNDPDFEIGASGIAIIASRRSSRLVPEQ